MREASAGQQGSGGVASVNGDGLIAETAGHGFEQPALHRVIVDDENSFGHIGSNAAPMCRFGASSPFWLNALLNADNIGAG
jgi:hypothetical protein